ncbi:hypothetical protein FQZ97_1009960 [compost metagenome]
MRDLRQRALLGRQRGQHGGIQAVAVDHRPQEQVGDTNDFQAKAQLVLPARIAFGDQLGKRAVNATKANECNFVFGHGLLSCPGSGSMRTSVRAVHCQLNMAIRCIYWPIWPVQSAHLRQGKTHNAAWARTQAALC